MVAGDPAPRLSVVADTPSVDADVIVASPVAVKVVSVAAKVIVLLPESSVRSLAPVEVIVPAPAKSRLFIAIWLVFIKNIFGDFHNPLAVIMSCLIFFGIIDGSGWNFNLLHFLYLLQHQTRGSLWQQHLQRRRLVFLLQGL